MRTEVRTARSNSAMPFPPLLPGPYPATRALPMSVNTGFTGSNRASSTNTTFFFVAKNMLDQTTIMDRTRGIYPGLPALWQVAAKWTF